MKRVLFVAVALFLALPLVGVSAQSASNGPRTLTVSKSQNLSVAGETISVSGSGFDVEKGIYIALCVIPPAGQIPSPCGGGADLGGTSGSSLWISSNPPTYGVGLAIPYGDGGTFSGRLDVGPVISANADCRVLKCAVVSRSDHTRLTDRSQDVFIPVTFGAPPTAVPTATQAAGATAVPTAPPATSTAIPTGAPSPTATPTPVAAPTVTLSADGLTATAGSARLSVSKAKDLDGAGEMVTVTGTGYDESHGIYVALCAIPEGGAAPGPCAAGGPELSAWFSSNPPDYAAGRASPFGTGGSFEVELLLRPVIDGATDCRIVACAIGTRADDTAADDRSHDLLIPVTFTGDPVAPGTTATPEPTPTAATATDLDGDSDGNGGLIWFVLGGAGLAGLALAGVLVGMRRRAGGAAVGMLAVLALLLGSCGEKGTGAAAPSPLAGEDAPIVKLSDTPSPALPVTVVSADGREVTVTDTTRIVSLWGNITEVVYGLGMGGSVVGRDSSATFPEVEGLPLVTRAHDTSAEGVLALNPTLVLASKDNSGPGTALAQIRNVGVPVIVFDDPASVEDIVPRIRAIAAALGVPEAGEDLVRLTEAEFAESRAAIPSGVEAPRVAFLYMRGTAGVYLIAGPGSGADSMIAAAGAIDAGTAMGLDNPFTPITSEALAQAAPDVILMTTSGLKSVGGISGLVEIPGIAQTPAGKNQRIVTIEDSLLYSYGPRTPLAIRLLIEQIYGAATPAGG